MSVDFAILKHLSKKTKYSVCGYLREIQWLLLSDENGNELFYANMPPLINNICLAYYRLGQYFEEGPQCFALSGFDNNTITKIQSGDRGWDNTVYSKDWIESNQNKVIKLIMKIERIAGGAAVGFGVINNNHHCNVNKSFYEQHSYAVFNSGYAYMDGGDCRSNVMECYTNDIVALILDLKNRQIILHRNNGKIEKREVVFENIRKQDNIFNIKWL